MTRPTYRQSSRYQRTPDRARTERRPARSSSRRRQPQRFFDRYSPVKVGIAAAVLLVVILFALSRCSGCGSADPAETSPSQGNEGIAATSETANEATEAESDSSRTDYGIADRVDELLQYPEMIGGCEIVSLTSMLNAMGYDTDVHNIASNYVTYGTGFVYTYMGDPYSDGGGYPPALTSIGNSYLRQQGSDYRFADLTGTSLSGLSYWLDKNVPVLIWTTMYLHDVMHTGYYEGEYEWYDNEHCVLAYKMDEIYVYVMDPMVGFTRYDRDTFESVYNECGKMAVSLDI